MTPADWSLFVLGWNEAHATEANDPPSWEEFEELKANYG
tara:strand:- start:409 stop:525 length:117 start_codon:yes stop_codon:yes gene_type:complete